MDWTDTLRALPALLVPERHADSLTRAATACLHRGDAGSAAVLLERRARLLPAPGAAERALAALATALDGRRAEAGPLVDAAMRVDPLDPTAQLVALRLAASPEAAGEAAERILASPLSTDAALATALAARFAGGARAAARLDLADGRLAGWIAWRDAAPPCLVLAGPAGEEAHRLASDPAGLGFALPGAGGTFIALAPGLEISGYRIERDGEILASGPLFARRRDGLRGHGGGPPAAVLGRRPIRIVVPVYDDPDATREALRAALLEAARLPGTEVVAVDDASPSPQIVALLDRLAARGLLALRRNAATRGYTGAVTRGLEGIGERDALLLNADTLLPPGSLARLADAAYAAADIGTATPLSNNGEWTSVPRLGEAAPFPGAEEIARLDAAAARAGEGIVDLPNGIGFALYVRHDCLAATGGLSAVYERGYFEDLEFCVRARRAGYRNVAAAGVFVGHHGSRSFGAGKAALVARNLRRFRRRFPALRAESAAFRLADPLRAVRECLEAACPPTAFPLLLVAPAGSPVAAARLDAHRAASRDVVTLRWRRAGRALRAELRGADGGAPQSLGFDAESETDAEALRGWLAELGPSTVELAGPPPPDALGSILAGLDAAFVILAGDLPRAPARLGPPAPSPLVAGFEGWRALLGERWLQVAALDRLTLAALHRHLRDDPDAARIEPALPMPPAGAPSAPAGGSTLALVVGAPSPKAAQFAGVLADALKARAPSARLLVLGDSGADLPLLSRGGVDATGPLGPREIAGLVRRRGAALLALAPDDPSLALFERVRSETGLPSVQTDWSLGAAPADPTSLLLEAARDDRDTAAAIVDGFAARLPA